MMPLDGWCQIDMLIRIILINWATVSIDMFYRHCAAPRSILHSVIPFEPLGFFRSNVSKTFEHDILDHIMLIGDRLSGDFHFFFLHNYLVLV